jgi:hypothetical protein
MGMLKKFLHCTWLINEVRFPGEEKKYKMKDIIFFGKD